MSETALTDSQANDLAGTTDPDLDVTYCDIGEAQYYTTDLKKEAIVLRVLKSLPQALRVFKDGDLTFGVRAGEFLDGATLREYAGADAQSLTDDATNYVYLTAAGALTKNTTGFPTTPHVPLATIVTASGGYAHDDITDCRSRSAFQVVGGLTIAAGAESADKRTRLRRPERRGQHRVRRHRHDARDGSRQRRLRGHLRRGRHGRGRRHHQRRRQPLRPGRGRRTHLLQRRDHLGGVTRRAILDVRRGPRGASTAAKRYAGP